MNNHIFSEAYAEISYPFPIEWILSNLIPCSVIDISSYLCIYLKSLIGKGLDFENTRLKLIEAEWCIFASVNIPILVQIMACRLIGAKPLSQPLLKYCFISNHRNKLQWNHTFSFKKMQFCPGLNVLSWLSALCAMMALQIKELRHLWK